MGCCPRQLLTPCPPAPRGCSASTASPTCGTAPTTPLLSSWWGSWSACSPVSVGCWGGLRDSPCPTHGPAPPGPTPAAALDPRTISPVVPKLLCCLPPKIRRWLCCGGVDPTQVRDRLLVLQGRGAQGVLPAASPVPSLPLLCPHRSSATRTPRRKATGCPMACPLLSPRRWGRRKDRATSAVTVPPSVPCRKPPSDAPSTGGHGYSSVGGFKPWWEIHRQLGRAQ